MRDKVRISQNNSILTKINTSLLRKKSTKETLILSLSSSSLMKMLINKLMNKSLLNRFNTRSRRPSLS
jgi:hypothetical protein